MAATRKASSSVPSAVPRMRSADPACSVAIRSSKVGGDGGALGNKRVNSFIGPPYQSQRPDEPRLSRPMNMHNIRKMPLTAGDNRQIIPVNRNRARLSSTSGHSCRCRVSNGGILERQSDVVLGDAGERGGRPGQVVEFRQLHAAAEGIFG